MVSRVIEIALLRHWPTEWNVQKKIQGRSDIPLLDSSCTELSGFRLPADYEDWSLHLSPLARAQQTAAHLGLGQGKSDPRLIEMDFGAYEGATLAQLRQEGGMDFAQNENLGLDFRPPGGETPREVQSRALSWLRDTVEENSNAFAITHKGVIRALLAKAAGWSMVGKPPVKLDWKNIHVFRVDDHLSVTLHKVNVPLERR